MHFGGLDVIVSTGISKLNIPQTDILFPPNVNEIVIDKPKEFIKK